MWPTKINPQSHSSLSEPFSIVALHQYACAHFQINKLKGNSSLAFQPYCEKNTLHSVSHFNILFGRGHQEEKAERRKKDRQKKYNVLGHNESDF